MNYLAELNKALDAARVYKNKLEADREAHLRAAGEAFDWVSENRTHTLVELNKAAEAARAAFEDDRIKKVVERSGKDGQPAIGSVMIEWTNRASYYGTKTQWDKTGRKGHVEVWTADAVYPNNMRWGLPSVGDLFIRVLKNDGKDAITFETLRGSYKSTWLPEGVKP